jgi:hypothetical protein
MSRNDIQNRKMRQFFGRRPDQVCPDLSMCRVNLSVCQRYRDGNLLQLSGRNVHKLALNWVLTFAEWELIFR